MGQREARSQKPGASRKELLCCCACFWLQASVYRLLSSRQLPPSPQAPFRAQGSKHNHRLHRQIVLMIPRWVSSDRGQGGAEKTSQWDGLLRGWLGCYLRTDQLI